MAQSVFSRPVRWGIAFLIFLACLALLWSNEFALGVFTGACAFFIALATLNKGRKDIVNLRTDITPISFLFAALVAIIACAFPELWWLALIILLVIAFLYSPIGSRRRY